MKILLSHRNAEFLNKVRNEGCKWLKRFFLLYLITCRRKKGEYNKVSSLAWFGAYGNTNIGDDLIFFALKKYIPNSVKIQLSCRQQIPTTDYGVETFYRGDRRKCKKVVQNADVVWLGGGGLFEYYAGSYPESWIVMHLLPLAYALHYGKRYAIVGMGCNEKAIPSRAMRYIFRQICNKAEFIITRDEKSKRGFESNGVKNLKLHACLDPVLNLESKMKLGREIKTVGILAWPFYMWPFFHSSRSLDEMYSKMSDERKEKHKCFVAELIRLKKQLERSGLNVAFPLFHFSDKILLQELGLERKGTDYGLPTIDRYFNEIDKCDIVISMRYHGQITNYTRGNIVISVPVQEKMFALNERFDAKDLEVEIDKFSCDAIMNLIHKIQGNPNHYRERSRVILDEIQPFIQATYETASKEFFNRN